MARSSFSSDGWPLAGCSARHLCSRFCAGRRRCRSPCRRAGGVLVASAPTAHRRRYNPQSGRPSAGRRWGGKNNPSARGFSSSARRANARSLGRVPPFSTRSATMCFHRRGIDQNLRRRTSRRCQSAEDVRPNAFGCPAHKAVIERLMRAIDIRRIDPAPAGFQNMYDAADDTAIIDPWFAACIRRKMRLKPRKLCGVQPEIISNHYRSPFGDRESQNHRQRNPFYGS